MVSTVTARPLDLPDFSDPPLAETVLSVHFDRLSALRTAHFGLYWDEIRTRFPKTEEQGELPPVVERFPEQPQPMVGIQFEALGAPPPPRFWFIDDKGTELIQVQRDRFIKNWRRTGEGDLYPRYERVRDGFDRDFSDFAEFVSRNQLGTIRVNQCEVTYVNHIVSGAGWETHADISKVFTVWKQPQSAYPGQAQDLTFRAKFPIADQSGGFVGRLHVTLQPVTRLTDGSPMFLLELTARGQIGEGADFFDVGREWIVRSFAELTTPTMHKVWGRRN
jgi:uncharacterized protein (TIGR04255 family)